MLAFLLIVAMLALIIDLMAIVLFKPESVTIKPQDQWPMISILVPMRNEAVNVNALVENLLELDYPSDRMEILIGEDRSTDQTSELLEKQASLDPRIRVVLITEDLPDLKAKANVIGQLIPHAKSDYYFITDADVRLPANWLKAYLSVITDKAGVIGGTTVVKVHDFWTALQNIDWIFAQGLLYTAGKNFRTVATSGTNMLVTRKVCEAVGGYDKIPFWLTEDIGILTAARKSGFTGMNILDEKVAAVIEAQPDWGSLMSQRSRWVYGVLRLPKIVIILLLIRSLFLIFVILVAWWSVKAALAIYVFKVAINWIFIRRVAACIGQTIPARHFLYFEVYYFLMSMGGLFSHLFSPDTNWKGRNY